MLDGFHWRDGLYFERMSNGDVQLTQTRTNSDVIEWRKVIPMAEWVSIIAAMSTMGETYQSIEVAKGFHNWDTNPIKDLIPEENPSNVDLDHFDPKQEDIDV